MRAPFLSLVITSSLLLTSCSFHEVNTDPKPLIPLEDPLNISGDYRSADPSHISSRPKVDGLEDPHAENLWWGIFKDPILDQLILQGLNSNLTVEQGIERVVRAQLIEGQAVALRAPQLDLLVQANQGWDRDQRFATSNGVGGRVSWDPDLFGSLRARQMAERFFALSESTAQQQLRLITAREIAFNYFSLLERKNQLDLLQDQVRIDRELLDLVKQSFEAGIVSRVDLLQQQGQLANTESLIPFTQRELRVIENRLDVLLARPPGGRSPPIPAGDFPELPVIPEVGLSSDILLNRPDLRSARDALVAADALVAEAVANRLPQILLTGSSLYEVGSGAPGMVSSVIGSLFQPVIDWGLRKLEVERAESSYREILLDFSERFLQAAEEVDNALFRIRRQFEYVTLLTDRQNILEQTLQETRTRYEAGLTDYLPVLDALQQLRLTERTIIFERMQLLIFYIDLYTALGGRVLDQVQ